MGLTLTMTLIFEFSRSYVILTIWWPRSGVRIYQIVTGVTSDVGVPSTHLVVTWWRHRMGTFSSLLALCAENSPVTGEFPSQRPVTRSFDVFFDLPLNKRLSKQSRRRWFETQSRPLWHHCNGIFPNRTLYLQNVPTCHWYHSYIASCSLL